MSFLESRVHTNDSAHTMFVSSLQARPVHHLAIFLLGPIGICILLALIVQKTKQVGRKGQQPILCVI